MAAVGWSIAQSRIAATWFAALYASTAKYDAEIVACAGLAAPPLVAGCQTAAFDLWMSELAASAFIFARDSAIASTTYYTACEISELMLFGDIRTADNNWFTSAQACNPPPGVLPERSEIVAGEEPNPPQYVEGHL